MEDVSYLSEINESLEQKYSYLVVRIGENISFNGGSDNEKILSELPVSNAKSRFPSLIFSAATRSFWIGVIMLR